MVSTNKDGQHSRFIKKALAISKHYCIFPANTEQSEHILIIHGTQDEIVPFDDSKTFTDDNLIEFLPIEAQTIAFRIPIIWKQRPRQY